MNVKNIVVNGKNVFLDVLIRQLIKYNISYVLVDNYEIHFENYIIRLYELCDISKLEKEILSSNLIRSINEVDKLPFYIQRIKEDNYELFKPENEINYFKEDKPKYTKKLIKQQNKIYSNRINTKRIK